MQPSYYDIIDALNDMVTGNFSRIQKKTGSLGVGFFLHQHEDRRDLDLYGPAAMSWLTSVSDVEPCEWYGKGPQEQRHARLDIEGCRVKVLETRQADDPKRYVG